MAHGQWGEHASCSNECSFILDVQNRTNVIKDEQHWYWKIEIFSSCSDGYSFILDDQNRCPAWPCWSPWPWPWSCLLWNISFQFAAHGKAKKKALCWVKSEEEKKHWKVKASDDYKVEDPVCETSRLFCFNQNQQKPSLPTSVKLSHSKSRRSVTEEIDRWKKKEEGRKYLQTSCVNVTVCVNESKKKWEKNASEMFIASKPIIWQTKPVNHKIELLAT